MPEHRQSLLRFKNSSMPIADPHEVPDKECCDPFGASHAPSSIPPTSISSTSSSLPHGYSPTATKRETVDEKDTGGDPAQDTSNVTDVIYNFSSSMLKSFIKRVRQRSPRRMKSSIALMSRQTMTIEDCPRSALSESKRHTTTSAVPMPSGHMKPETARASEIFFRSAPSITLQTPSMVEDTASKARIDSSPYVVPRPPADVCGLHVLVIDTDPLVHSVLTRAVQGNASGVSVCCVGSGDEALAKLGDLSSSSKQQPEIRMGVISAVSQQGRHDSIRFPDAIIVDYRDVSICGRNCGVTVASEIRRRFPKAQTTPIIAYTSDFDGGDAFSNAAFVANFLNDSNGFSDYVSKSATVNDLLARIFVQVRLNATHRRLARLERADCILKDVLPGRVVDQLLDVGHVEPEYLGQVTVLFTDIVKYTEIVSTTETPDVIRFLDQLFSAFDRLATHFGVLKVETIGDSYMCVAGHNNATDKSQARLMVLMGLAMIEAASDVKLAGSEAAVEIRAGIHTGPAYAGVVGEVRPRYCLFGDTVNVASRMESSSKPGMLQVSEATCASCFSTPTAESSSGKIYPEESSPQLLQYDEKSHVRTSVTACMEQSYGVSNCTSFDDLFYRIARFTPSELQHIKGKGAMATRFCIAAE